GKDAILSGIIVAMDRQEKGTGDLSAIQEIEKKYNIPVIHIINLQNIIDYLDASNSSNLRMHAETVNTYRRKYGV
ncbi:MAG: orotate phosphoribosyltransferase, partial [Gammaproteobacteria bacterium]|nr:orotate phosphoribosyltransferase [Gammaproteobacteria bacterium]